MTSPSVRSKRRALALAAAIGTVSSTGCFTTVIRSGAPSAPPTVEYDAKWHHGLVWGIAEVSGPYDLAKACPNGWAQIKTETSFFNGFVQAITWGIYSPQSVTIQCAAGGAPTGPATSTPPVPQVTPAGQNKNKP